MACCVLSCGCVLSSNSWAEDVKIETSITQSGVWDSNPLRRKTDIKELYGETTAPKISIKKEQPTTSLALSAWIENSIFNQHEYNTTDFYGRLNLAKKTERLTVQLGASGDYDTTRTSELTTFGIATEAVRHSRYSMGPSVSYLLSPISEISLSGDYAKARYDAHNYVDYHTVSISPAYTRKFSEKYSGLVALNARRYESDEGIDRIVDSIGPSIGVVAKFSDRWSGDIRIGQEASRDKRADVVVRDWTWNSIYSANISFKGDQDLVRFSLSRAQQPYGNGSESLLTTLSLNGEKKVNQLFSVNGGGDYQFSGESQTESRQMDTQFSGKAGLVYHITETLGLTSSYMYKYESFMDDDSVVKQNIVRLGLTYRPQFDSFW
ncbi:MAG: hypothetical protein PHD48_05165 [Alphaproteobacteria bacterium]|nr:hypothetical protein [Alphaproteobacteria bacterium]